MLNEIARVKLVSGEIKYEDENLNLTFSEPFGIVYSNYNINQINKAIKENKIELVSGNLIL